jgi:hypothetical protein
MRLSRFLGWSAVPLAALVGTGAVAAGRLVATPAPVSRPASAFFAPPASCAPGPVTTGDLADAPGGGYERFAYEPVGGYREFFFARAMYTDGFGRGGFGFGFGGGRGGFELGDGGPRWSVDYVNADRHIVQVTQRLSNIDACRWEHPVSLADPDLRRFPFIYSLEWGYADLTDAEVEGLRGFLEAGGFLMIDDFWGSQEWYNFARQMNRVLPHRVIQDVPRDHLLFHIHYTIDGEIIQVPGFGGGIRGRGTSQRDGYEAKVRGIFDDEGRLMVVINWNTDLGDALEHAENPYYPLEFSTFASELFLNMIMYSMTS